MYSFVQRFATLKTLLYSILLVGLFCMSPENLFSQSTAQAPSSTETQKKTTATPYSSTPHLQPSTTSAKTGSQTPVQSQSKSLSQQELEKPLDTLNKPSLITQALLLSLLALLPFVIMILTSFLKIVVVLSLLRTALGVQQAPPNQIINGVAFLLSLFIMYPTVMKMYDAGKQFMDKTPIPSSLMSEGSSTYVLQMAEVTREPLRDFLRKNSSGKHQALFYRLAYKGLPENHRDSLKPDDFIILVPSFITGQLKDAFEIGVLIYIPFFVIDLVTSNILLAMGMMMLSPVTISMPLKLFLLVMLDGWTILIEGLVKTFQ